ncbi:MAG: hypothetical protein KDK39_01850 [Leptospiraceae bacterium]|nr:hypothetical protein [Leptospiraceae bacterium]
MMTRKHPKARLLCLAVVYCSALVWHGSTRLVASNETTGSRAGEVEWRTVRLHITKKIYNPLQPYSVPAVQSAIASGFYIGKGRILSSLESVRYATHVEAQFKDRPDRLTIQRSIYGFDCGLALLEFDLPAVDDSKQSENPTETDKQPAETSDTGKTDAKTSPGDAQRELNLKLLKKSDSDIPFVEMETETVKEEESDTETTRTRIDPLRLPPLPFTIQQIPQGYELQALTWNREANFETVRLRFIAERFQTLMNSDVDYHWLYAIHPVHRSLDSAQSGAPVLYQDRIVGILQSPVTTLRSQSVAPEPYIIPAGVIRAFLDDLSDGRYDGLKHSGLVYEPILNAAARKDAGLQNESGGLIVRQVAIHADYARSIRPGDILLRLDQQPIDRYGMLQIEGQRLNVEEYLRSRLRVKKDVQASLLRGKQILNSKIEPRSYRDTHPGRLSLKAQPPWVLAGGLVFRGLDYGLFHSLPINDQSWLNQSYQDFIRGSWQPGREPVILLERLTDTANTGAEFYEGRLLLSINQRRVFSLPELYREWQRTRSEWVRLDFADQSQPLILPFSVNQAINQRVMQRFQLQENGRVY